MDDQAVKTWLEILGLAGGASITLFAAWRWGWSAALCVWQRFIGFWRALLAMPAIMQSLPSKFEELFEEGRVRSTELASHTEQISKIGMKVESIANTQRAVMNTNPRMATFQADTNGAWIDTNKTFGKWTGLALTESLGWRWFSAVHPRDHERVRSTLLSCIADGRRWECRFLMVHTTTRREFEVDASADPVPDYPAPTERWFGSMFEASPAQP